MKFTHIIWDWNGTLLDDVDLSLMCVNHILQKRNMQPIDIQQYRDFVDTPIIRFYEHLFDFNKITFDVIADEFYTFYKKNFSMAGLAPHAVDILNHFKDCGCRQIILSSANTADIQNYMHRLGISEYFTAILGADDFQVGDKIKRAQNYFADEEHGNMLLVGDTTHDSDAAAILGAECILYARGHQPQSRLFSTGLKVINDLADLLNL